MSNHTPAPWGIEQTDTTNWIGPLRADGKTAMLVCETDREGLRADALVRNDADARRIVACVNACEGISTEDLESAAAQTDPRVRLSNLTYYVERAGMEVYHAMSRDRIHRLQSIKEVDAKMLRSAASPG
jgi:hypothetical protein